MSTIIKAGEAGPILPRLATVDLADHLAEARAVIEEAKRRAGQIEAQAEQDLRRVVEEAQEAGYQTGHQRGYAEGIAQGRRAGLEESVECFNREHTQIVSVMEQAVAGMEAIREDLRVAAESDLLDFAVLVASRLTFAVGRLHRESAQDNLRRALRLVGSKTDVTILVHPDDHASMETFADSVLRQANASQAVNVVTDDSVAPGGCRVQSGGTAVDAALDTQVDEMVALLLGERRGRDD